MGPPSGATLGRKELQHYLKLWGLRATGTTASLRITYEQARTDPSLMAVAASAAAADPSSRPNKKKKALPRTPQKEKRLKRFRSSCPSKISDRIGRALTQRLYLVKRGNVMDSFDDPHCEFIVLGSTGNVYNVRIGKLSTCDCPDHARGNHPCKHILFVMLKVIGLPPDSPHIYQFALTSSELKEIFGTMQERRVGGASVMANASVQSTYAKLEKGGSYKDEDDGAGQRRSLEQDADCPICFDPMKNDGTLTYCRAMCGANFHADCIRRWCLHNQNCPNCRQPWQDGTKKRSAGEEGYTNLGRLQGQSPYRDTSTYRYREYSPRRYW